MKSINETTDNKMKLLVGKEANEIEISEIREELFELNVGKYANEDANEDLKKIKNEFNELL